MGANGICNGNPALSHGARVRSTGIVVAIGRKAGSSAMGNIVVCSAALDGPSPAPILVEYVMPQDDTGMQAHKIACGDIVEGEQGVIV